MRPPKIGGFLGSTGSFTRGYTLSWRTVHLVNYDSWEHISRTSEWMFFGGYEKKSPWKIGTFSNDLFFWKRFSINKWDGRTWGIAAAICALRRYDVDLWLDFVSVIVGRTMISVGLIKEEIFVVRVAWISIGFSLHIPRKISIITLLSLNAIITIVIITLLSQFLLSLHIILLTFISRLFSEKNAVHYRK